MAILDCLDIHHGTPTIVSNDHGIVPRNTKCQHDVYFIYNAKMKLLPLKVRWLVEWSFGDNGAERIITLLYSQRGLINVDRIGKTMVIFSLPGTMSQP